MLNLNRIVGRASDADVAPRLHDLEHAGAVEYVILGQEDARRHRLRATTDKGTECAIALPRNQHLSNGAVLLLTDARAIVVRTRSEDWLVLSPAGIAAALEVGYFAGNMHWRVGFEGERLRIALEGPRQDYLDRLHHLLSAGRVEVVSDD